MTQHTKEKQALAMEAHNIRNQKQLSTLKLWQLHLQSLSKPKKKPLLSDDDENYDLTISTANKNQQSDDDLIPLSDDIN